MGTKRRAPNAALGVLKGLGWLLALPVVLVVWACRGAAARRRLCRQLILEGIPEEAARRLAGRYKLELLRMVRTRSA